MTLLEKSTFLEVVVAALAPSTGVNLRPKPSELGSSTRVSMGMAIVLIVVSQLSKREVPLCPAADAALGSLALFGFVSLLYFLFI